MKKIITICLVFYSIGLLAQLAPFSRSKGGSISGPPIPITETDPLSVKLVGNDNITGIKKFIGSSFIDTVIIDGEKIDIIRNPANYTRYNYGSIFLKEDLNECNIWPTSILFSNGTYTNSFSTGAWYFSDNSGYGIESEPHYMTFYSPGFSTYLSSNQILLNRPIVTTPNNAEAINYLETKKLFVSRNIQDTITANKIFTSGYLKINGSSSIFHTLNGNSSFMYDPINGKINNSSPSSLTLEDENTGAQIRHTADRTTVNDRGGYVPGNNDYLTKSEIASFISAIPNTVVFTSSGTYTPTPGMRYIEVEMIGGGGGSGCAAESTGIGNQRVSGSAGAGAGGYAKFRMTAAQVGASVTVTVGAGGLGATTITTPTAGANGGTTSFGASNVCTGGAGSSSAPVDSVAQVIGAPGGSCTIGAGTQIIKIPGGNGDDLFGYYTGRLSLSQADSPEGGNSYYGQGGRNRKLLIISGTAFWGVGETPTGIYGAGASGWYYINNAGSYGGNAGSNGAPGIVTIKEYF